MSEVINKVTIKQAVKIMSSNKNMSLTEVARASGRGQSTLSNLLANGNPNLNTIKEILNGMGEELIIVSSSGQKFQIETK